MQDEKAWNIDEIQLIRILKELNLPTWAIHRKILLTLMRSEGSFNITEVIKKTSLPWRKTYGVIRDFMQIGLLHEIPYKFPEDWALYTLSERKNFRIMNNLPMKGKLPLRYTFNYEALIQHLDIKYKKKMENIDAQAQAEKNRLT